MTRARIDRTALSLAALAFAVSAPVLYILQRLFEQSRGIPGNPGMVLRTAHTAYFWRVSIALWCAGLLAMLVYGHASPARATRLLRPLLAIAAALSAAVIVIAIVFP